ncbi:MAG TPA: metallophosphoesterase [Pyrinomonadaceae bacterium]|nr:metallophosphoesterase [Pyrinomonadaceae bacterium]
MLWAENKKTSFTLYSKRLKSYLKERDVDAEIKWAQTADAVFTALTDPDPEFDVFITDIEMPNYDGTNTAKFLRTKNPKLPSIIISVHVGEIEIDNVLYRLKQANVIDGFFSHLQYSEWCEAVWRLVARRAPSILHLSDIHFGRFHALKRDLRIEDLISPALDAINADGKVDLVVISGDLSSEGKRSELKQADKFLCHVRDVLGLGLEQFVIVPGNHDIVRSEESEDRFATFIDFLNRFYGKLDDPTIVLRNFSALFESENKQLGLEHVSHIEESLHSLFIFDDVKTVVIGMNSVISSDQERWNLSEIQPQQLIAISEELNNLPPHQAEYFRIAVLHHNLFVVPSFTGDGEPERAVRNQGLILHHLIANRVKLILHGHTHYSIGYKYLPFFLGRSNATANPIHVFGTGTMSGEETTKAQSYFHMTVIRCDLDDKGRVNTAKVIPYRLVDDALPWEMVNPISISFDA